MNDNGDNAELFLVRVRREDSIADPRALRGSIVQVSSGRQLSFSDLDEARDFIVLRLLGTEVD